MQVAYQVLRLLSSGQFHSGQQIAASCNVSRARVWQAVEALREYGLTIHAVKGRGYKLEKPVDLLSRSDIYQHLTQDAQTNISSVEIFNQIDSTNDYISRSLSRIQSGYLCLAEGQLKGKGSRGRAWHSPMAKNIAFSFYREMNMPLHQAQGISLLVGLAVVKAIESILGPVEGLGVKWPNDIWYKDAKLGGILIESHGHTHDKATCNLIIGIGLNTHHIQLDDETNQVTSLEQICDHIVSRNQLIAFIVNELTSRLDIFEHKGLKPFMQEWTQYDQLLGKPLWLKHLNQTDSQGYAAGINDQGALMVKNKQGYKAYLSGDVQVRPYAITS